MTTSAASKTTVPNEGNMLCAEVVDITNSISVGFQQSFGRGSTGISPHIASTSMTALANAAGAS